MSLVVPFLRIQLCEDLGALCCDVGYSLCGGGGLVALPPNIISSGVTGRRRVECCQRLSFVLPRWVYITSRPAQFFTTRTRTQTKRAHAR